MTSLQTKERHKGDHYVAEKLPKRNKSCGWQGVAITKFLTLKGVLVTSHDRWLQTTGYIAVGWQLYLMHFTAGLTSPMAWWLLSHLVLSPSCTLAWVHWKRLELKAPARQSARKDGVLKRPIRLQRWLKFAGSTCHKTQLKVLLGLSRYSKRGVISTTRMWQSNVLRISWKRRLWIVSTTGCHASLLKPIARMENRIPLVQLTIFWLDSAIIQSCVPSGVECPNFMSRKDPAFCDLTGTLQVRYRELRMDGVGAVVKHASIVTPEEEDMLWESKVIGVHTPLALVHAVFFTSVKPFVWGEAKSSGSLKDLNSSVVMIQTVIHTSKMGPKITQVWILEKIIKLCLYTHAQRPNLGV